VKLIPNTLVRSVARQALTIKKDSPHIFFAGGIVGFVGTTVLACRATLKLSDTMNTFNEDIEQVKGLGKDVKDGSSSNYDATQYQKDMAYVYGKNTIAVVKLYAPSVALGALSIAALTGSHVSLTRRNAALTATVVAVTEAYSKYREAVAKEIGEDTELEIYQNHERYVVEKDEKGKDTGLLPVVGDPSKYSMYARIFDEYNVNWEKNAEINKLFVTCQQSHANNTLQVRGHIFLNEVYELLGFDHSQAGAVVGWVLNDEGDNFVDFGMYDVGSSNFVNGDERSILLDFNVDGVIFDKI